MKARHKVLLNKRLQHETKRKAKAALHQQILKKFNIMRTRRLENSGPHDELIDAYYPKRKSPSPYRQKMAATYIQKFVRGWLLRTTYNKIKIKALGHGESLSAVVRQYRQMMTRLRRRFDAPWEPIPLVYSDFEEWLNRKKKYEDMFAKREFWKEINKNELPNFFQDCDHYPSLREINETWGLINAGSYNSQSETLTKKQVVELAFTIYPPPGAGLGDRSTYRSTWVRPVVNGEEGFKYILADHPILKEAKIEVVGDLVTHSMFQRNQIQKFSKNLMADHLTKL
ncbi:IQ domain-containing protein M-like [Mobula hypostoma]|uniref:IQ domain-containing protein M-like n=1 Tax=Mobula hypostoma TaxID=723540 RepID=UPI002FC34EBB